MNAKRPSSSILDKAYESLKTSIVDGAYKPGQRLKALRLAQDLKVSRTPVKEALARLEQEGLVRRERGSGYIVRGLSVSEILNLYRVREVLEMEAAREAMEHVDEEVLRQMREILNRADNLLAQKRFSEFLRVNRKFHNLIVTRSGNNVLQELLNNLDARFWSIGTIVLSRHPQRAHEIRRENRAILDAFAAGDIRNIERAVRAHVKGAAKSVRIFIECEPQHLLVMAA